MEIRCVGSGERVSAEVRFQTCIALHEGQSTVLVDCGSTSLVALKARGVSTPAEIDAVVITRLHGDHFGGLPFLILDGQFQPADPASGTPVTPHGCRPCALSLPVRSCSLARLLLSIG